MNIIRNETPEWNICTHTINTLVVSKEGRAHASCDELYKSTCGYLLFRLLGIRLTIIGRRAQTIKTKVQLCTSPGDSRARRGKEGCLGGACDNKDEADAIDHGNYLGNVVV